MVAAYMSEIQPSKIFYLLIQLSLKKAEKYMSDNRSIEIIKLKKEIIKRFKVFAHLF